MSHVASLLAANARYAAGFTAGHLDAPPRRRLAIVTCMDGRVDPLRLLGLDLGDAHVLRNAGGRASDDAIRSLAIGRTLLGIETALVIHHTDCRMTGGDNAALRAAVAAAGGSVSPAQDFLPLPELETGVRADVTRLRESPLIPPGLAVHGFIYDVATGRLSPVDG